MKGGTELLIPLSGRLFLLEVASGTVRAIDAPAGTPIDPRPAPSGDRVGYVVGQDFYVLNLGTGDETRLSRHEHDTVTYGLAEFVAQEEMDRDEGYWFSPDGTRVAIQRKDTAPVGTIHLADSMNPFRAPHDTAYPRPGEHNVEVGLHIMPSAGPGMLGDGEAGVAVQWDRDRFPYLTTVTWPESGPLTIVVQNRLQTVLQVRAVDAESGATRLLLEERDDAWLELDQDVPRWLADGTGFLWTTERNGAKQLELRRADGSLAHAITDPGFGYRGLTHVDEPRGELLVTAATDPTVQELWRQPLAGGPAERLALPEGHLSAEVAKNGSVYAVSSSPAVGSRAVRVVHREEGERGVLTSHAVDLGYAPSTTWTTVGEKEFRVAITRPRDFDASQRYPVIVHVYAGPTSLMVRKTRDRYFLAQWFADHGFIVVSIDGRGTPYRDRAWHRAVKHDLVTLPMVDQVAALRALGARFPELDIERAGMFGWSFGGYASAMAVMRHGDVFKAGVAGAPVTDWQDYDTHYTERYLGLPQDTPEAYRVSNVLTYADQLERPLMIVHGTADDNVLFVHALKMSDAPVSGWQASCFRTLGRAHPHAHRARHGRSAVRAYH